MPKPLLHIRAKTKNGVGVDLFFYSVRQAAYFNPGLKDFRAIEEQHGMCN